MKTLVLAALLTTLSYACFVELDADAVLEGRSFRSPVAAGTCGEPEPAPVPVPAALASPGREL